MMVELPCFADSNGDYPMDRRLLLTSIAAAAAASACTRRNDDQATADRTGRPTLAIESEGPGRWRLRRWPWRANAWRQIGRAAGRARGSQYVEVSVVGGSLKKKQSNTETEK